MASVHSGSNFAAGKQAPNMKSALKQCEIAMQALTTGFGAQGQDSGALAKVPKDAIDKVGKLQQTLEKLLVPSKDNPNPYQLDSQVAFVNAINSLKEDLNDVKYYAGDFKKRGFVEKQLMGTKIKEKLNLRLDSIAMQTMMIDNMAQKHNENLQ